MKIAFIVGRFPVLSEAFILNQITGLIDRGHQVDIYALEGYELEEKVHPDVEKYHLLEHTYYAPKIPENYVWRTLKALWLLTTNFWKNPLACLQAINVFKYGKKAASLRILYTAIPFLGSQQYEIIHSQFGIYALEVMFVRDVGGLKGKLISSFRGYDISWYVQEKGDRIYDRLFKTADFFLTNCDFFKRRILKLGCDPNKVLVHRSGINCNRFAFNTRHPSSDGVFRIATTGRLIEKKGIEYAIRAIAKVAENYPNIEYNIIGDGYLKEFFQQLITDLKMQEKVKLLGWRNQQEIIETLDKTHIFIAPSVTAADGNQDAPVNTLKEAMAMGLPVIGTQHGGIPELIEDGISGFLVPERDADAIAQKLIHLIEHPEQWPQMGKAGRAYVEKHYETNKLNDELVEVYQQLVNRGKFPEPTLKPQVSFMQT
ncbi:glycosyltransferase [Aerosakkonemataceae cyanobacterium BLCC-F154]|uniref:Glycosyltransferase n=1 Tax=Floridaenema fluviatile BLCC-F154 TaxID=3153640 RepID=A0ABV4YC52_9CYAN